MNPKQVRSNKTAAPIRTGNPKRTKTTVPNKTRDGSSPRADRQRYATYKVELLIDERDHIRRTRISHIQSNAESGWAGWGETQLLDFIVEHAHVKTQSTGRLGRASVTMSSPRRGVQKPVESGPVDPSPAHSKLTGLTRLQELETMPKDSGIPRRVIAQDQPFSIHLTLDLADLTVPRGSPLDYDVSVYAKSLDGRPRQVVGQVSGIVAPSDHLTLNIDGAPLPAGTYRLEAAVALALPSAESSGRTGVKALLEGILLQVN